MAIFQIKYALAIVLKKTGIPGYLMGKKWISEFSIGRLLKRKRTSMDKLWISELTSLRVTNIQQNIQL